MGCPCHIVHNTAQKASQAFRNVIGFDVDDLIIDLFYYFDKSTKRKSELAEFAEFCDVTYRESIHHISVRWLSLQMAVDRALQQYPALKSYFASKEETSPRFKRLQSTFEDKMTEVYLLFYSYFLQYFVRLNLFLQRKEPIIAAVYEQVQKFVVLLCSKFIPVTGLKDVNLLNVNFKGRENQLEDEKLQIAWVNNSTEGSVNCYHLHHHLSLPKSVRSSFCINYLPKRTFQNQCGGKPKWEERMVMKDTSVWMSYGNTCMSTKKGGDGRPTFGRLSKIAKLLLVILHSNADEERVFSMVRKNKTPFRPNLGLDVTLPSLLTVKLATEEPCNKYNPPKDVVKRAGKVTWEYNKQHKN